jgi:hypothetical protein
MAVVLFSSVLEKVSATEAFGETERRHHLATLSVFYSEMFPLGAYKSSCPFNKRKKNTFLYFIS